MVRPIEDHLIDWGRMMIRDLGEQMAKPYLRGCVRLWRKEYGEVIADRAAKEIAAMFGKGK